MFSFIVNKYDKIFQYMCDTWVAAQPMLKIAAKTL